MGVKKKDIKNTTIVKKATDSSTKKEKLQTNSKLPTISILHTGGTIASKVDYRTGGVTADFSPEELVSQFPELKNIANIESELIAQMWSDDLRFAHFSLIAKTIEKHVKLGVKGIIVGMGTDNLAVASAALAFIIEKTPIPILLVGSQRSSDRGSTDAAMNLICAAEFITKTNFAGVAICMHGSSNDDICNILPATKTYKLHSSRRNAFQAVNALPIAIIDYKTKKITFTSEDYSKADKKLSIKPKMEEKVGLLKIHVNMFPEEFLAFKGFKGLVLEGTGLGHAPIHAPNPETKIHLKIADAIKELTSSGTIVTMTTQCIYGAVNMNVYSKGRDMQEINVIPGKDMLANTALVKLSWLLANHPKDPEKLLTENLRGEINEKISYQSEIVNQN